LNINIFYFSINACLKTKKYIKSTLFMVSSNNKDKEKKGIYYFIETKGFPLNLEEGERDKLDEMSFEELGEVVRERLGDNSYNEFLQIKKSVSAAIRARQPSANAKVAAAAEYQQGGNSFLSSDASPAGAFTSFANAPLNNFPSSPLTQVKKTIYPTTITESIGYPVLPSQSFVLDLVEQTLKSRTLQDIDRLNYEPGAVILVKFFFKNRELRELKGGYFKLGGSNEVALPSATQIANLNYMEGELLFHVVLVENDQTLTKRAFTQGLYDLFYRDILINMVTSNITLESIGWKQIFPNEEKYVLNYASFGTHGNLDPESYTTSVKPFVIALKHPLLKARRKSFSINFPFLVNELVGCDNNKNLSISQMLIKLKTQLTQLLTLPNSEGVKIWAVINTKKTNTVDHFFPVAEVDVFGFVGRKTVPKKLMGAIVTPHVFEKSSRILPSGRPSQVVSPPSMGTIDGNPLSGMLGSGSEDMDDDIDNDSTSETGEGRKGKK
jgi:hypothetical protein